MAFLRVAIMAALVTLATPVAAGEAEVVRTTSIPVKVEGSVQVEFTSSTAAGCVGPCNVSGSLTWAPAGEADLTVSDNRFPGRRELSASLFFLGGAEQDATDDHGARRHAMRPAAPPACAPTRAWPASPSWTSPPDLPPRSRRACSGAAPTTPVSSARAVGARSRATS